jgi:YD repeat-containing protein
VHEQRAHVPPPVRYQPAGRVEERPAPGHPTGVPGRGSGRGRGVGVCATSPTGQQARKTTHTYDSLGRRVSTVAPKGNVTRATAAFYTTTYGYDPDGRLATQTDPITRVTHDTHDAAGQICTPNNCPSTRLDLRAHHRSPPGRATDPIWAN